MVLVNQAEGDGRGTKGTKGTKRDGKWKMEKSEGAVISNQDVSSQCRKFRMVLPKINIEAEESLSAIFLPYQLHWIFDDSPLRLAEKSVRIGWTFADAFKNVRKRLRHPRRDYLFSTKD